MDRATRKILHESSSLRRISVPRTQCSTSTCSGSVELEHHRAKTGAVDVAGAESMFLYGLHVILTGLSRV